MINYKKIISSIFSITLLVGSLAAGLILIKEPQLFKQKAQNDYVGACNPAAKCTFDVTSIPEGSKPCLTRSGINHCCPVGEIIIDKSCVAQPQKCDQGLQCAGSKIFGSNVCLGGAGQVMYCCKAGYKLNPLGFCYKPLF